MGTIRSAILDRIEELKIKSSKELEKLNNLILTDDNHGYIKRQNIARGSYRETMALLEANEQMLRYFSEKN